MNWSSPLVLRIYKPAGLTSFDIIRKLKKLIPREVKKIGHFGTLDPFAEGLMLIGLNQASRLTQFTQQHLTKSYQAVGKLGVETPTQDLTDQVVQLDETTYFNTVISQFDIPFYQEQFLSFLGPYMQSPPAYSAAKYQGKKLCDWARKEGVEIKKEEVERYIYHLKVLNLKFPDITFEVECSSGTYIRTLFVDMAKKVGTIGSLKTLKRTKIGNISCELKHSLDNFLDNISDYLVPLTNLLPYPLVILDRKQELDFKHGRSWEILPGDEVHKSGLYWAQSETAELLGLAKHVEQKSTVEVGFSF